MNSMERIRVDSKPNQPIIALVVGGVNIAASNLNSCVPFSASRRSSPHLCRSDTFSFSPHNWSINRVEENYWKWRYFLSAEIGAAVPQRAILLEKWRDDNTPLQPPPLWEVDILLLWREAAKNSDRGAGERDWGFCPEKGIIHNKAQTLQPPFLAEQQSANGDFSIVFIFIPSFEIWPNIEIFH